MLITKFLHNCINVALKELILEQNITFDSLPEFIIEHPKNKDHGDYATSLPLQLSKIFKDSPINIANKLIKNIEQNNTIAKITVANPGFINFKMSNEWVQKEILNCISLEEKFGNSQNAKKYIQVEFVSVNPTGKLHLGHIRGAVIGSTLSNVLVTQNHSVTKEYYVNDAGNQLEIFCKSVIERMKEMQSKSFNISEEMYSGEDVKEIAQNIYPKYSNYELDKISDEIFDDIKNLSIESCIKKIKKDLESLNIVHDEWFYESSLLESNYFNETLEILDKLDLIYEKDGAIWIKTEELGDDRDNVLIKSGDRKPTYFATDIAYHRNKFSKRSFQEVINVWGSDHHGHINRMKIILEKLKIKSDNLRVILNQIVSLKRGDKSVKFSKRSGNSIFLSDIVEEIGSDACRYSFLNRSSESQMEVDLEIFKNKSSENPVFYIQYAHARLCSILKKAEIMKIEFNSPKSISIVTPEEINLTKKITEYPELLNRVSLNYGVHELTFYALELSQLIQKFYENNRVFDEESNSIEITKGRLLITKASKITLSNLLTLMGMNAPEEM